LAHAQQVFRIVGPDGRVTFSDKPPIEPNAKAARAATSPAGASASGSLPFELRQIASRFPVTLYTGPNCEPCGSGRAFLGSRGVPFTEKTVSSNDDIDALQRLSGAASLPFMTIGGQQLRGFSEVEWSQFLDAAGYPKTSQLPASYRPAPPSPLVAVQAPAAAPAAQPETARAASPAPAPVPAPAPANPAGIRF
jgi:glutaredoxin